MTTIYTTMCGGYDRLREQTEQNTDVDWVAIVDEKPEDVPTPWRVEIGDFQRMTPLRNMLSDLHPRMQAKWYKTHPWAVTDESDVIYIDANMVVTNPDFATEALACRRNGIAVWRHPNRRSIFAEAQASIDLAPEKYGHLPVLAQVVSYRDEGYHDKQNLYACGTIAYDPTDSRVRTIGYRWFAECERWSYQDQLSLPYVLWGLGI
jgi:hypothetical protein